MIYYLHKLLMIYFLTVNKNQLIYNEQVNVNLKKAGSKMEHQGIKIEFIGQIGNVFNY